MSRFEAHFLPVSMGTSGLSRLRLNFGRCVSQVLESCKQLHRGLKQCEDPGMKTLLSALNVVVYDVPGTDSECFVFRIMFLESGGKCERMLLWS